MGEPGSVIWATDPYMYAEYAALALALAKIPGGDPPDWSRLKEAGLITQEQIGQLTVMQHKMVAAQLAAQADTVKRQSEIHGKIAAMIAKNLE
ncbi:MAG TPA: hypothetical protein VEI81_06685 [Methanoregula sp.]|nr:hypothetical protein [Methanoregula sp.]